MSQSGSNIESLIQWAQENHSLLNDSVEIYEDTVTGLSFRAACDIASGTRLVECAYGTTLSYLNAIEAAPCFSRHDSKPFPAMFINKLSQDDPNVIGHFFLVQQYLLGEKSFWWYYIQLLPQPNQPERLGIPIWWPEVDQRFLDGTNAQPPIKKRRELWEAEWRQGVSFLRGHLEGWEQYTYTLYQWAATIFGSRSFRASLTIPNEICRDQQNSRVGSDLILDHIRADKFSILLPVLDIGNHNGVNLVNWSRGMNTFSFSNRTTITKGSQIYNYYGDKSNSELLVGYGFILPQIDKDRVNLKVTPPPEIQALRRSQGCHCSDPNQADQEFMFNVRMKVGSLKEKDQDSVLNTQANLDEPKQTPLQYFSHGLFDTIICMVANTRERRHISENSHYCPERDATIFEGPLARSAYQALGVLRIKIEYEIARMKQSKPRGQPRNRDQELALDYRKRQIDVLTATLQPISNQMASAQLLSLESAFDWLRMHYPDISLAVEKDISEDQEEPLPLNWDILVEDWDHTYWIVWVYLVLSLEALDPKTFRSLHPIVSQWISGIQTIEGPLSDRLLAEPSELETLNHMIESIASRFGHVAAESQKLQNIASFIVKEETVRGLYVCKGSGRKGQQQDLLCIHLQ